MIGKTISHYRILEKLGEGGMGVVYKAHDNTLDRVVALKFLPHYLTSDPTEKQRFYHEAKAASALNHTNITTIYEISEFEGQLFIAMESVEGKTLKQLVEHEILPVKKILDIAIQVCDGLAAAHEKGIVHRDIKSENIMVTPRGQAKIMDFGLAKVKGATKLTKESSTLGTAAYMSPEQAQGEEVDLRSDIFSFGVVLYELLTGKLPFKGEHHAALMYSIVNEEPPPVARFNEKVGPEIEHIVARALAKDREDRYQHADEVLAEIRHERKKLDYAKAGYVAAEGLSVTPKSKRRSMRMAAVGGALVVVAMIVLAYLFLLPKPATVSQKSIAVLPFQNLSVEGPYAYFAGGLHDELLTQLSKVAALKVISRTSVMGYAGTTKPIKQIANELNVRSIVEGSVQVAGERLRVNVQLIDAAKDEHLWAERYDRTLDDAFAIQSDVAQQIVKAVGAALSNTEQQGLAAVPTANAEAYRLYLQGREYYTRPGYLRQNIEIAQELYQRALALDPGFALAHAALATTHGQMYWYRFDPSPTRAELQREEAKTALRLAPSLPQAHAAMGLAYYYGRRDYRRALEEFSIALERLPNEAILWAGVGYVNRRLGHWEEVIAAFEKAKQLDPRSANLFFDLGGNTYLVMHRYAEAVRAYDEALSLAPDFNWAAITKGWVYIYWQGQLDTLRAALRRLPRDAELGSLATLYAFNFELLYFERQADSLLHVLRMMHVTVFEEQDFFLPRSLCTAWAHQMLGDRSAARSAFDSALVLLDSTLQNLPDDWRVHSARGLALAGLGRRDEALNEARWLQQSEVYRKDAFQGPLLAENRAQILAQAGETSAALDEIKRLLEGPSWLSVHTLRLNPLWDPIRDNPRFQALLTKYFKR